MNEIRPLTDYEIHHIACEVDHDLKNVEGGLSRVRWNNRAVGCLLATIGKYRDDSSQLAEAVTLLRDYVGIVEPRFVFQDDIEVWERVKSFLATKGAA